MHGQGGIPPWLLSPLYRNTMLLRQSVATPLPAGAQTQAWPPQRHASRLKMTHSTSRVSTRVMHIAIHDALNAVDRRFKPYTFDKKADTRNVTGCRSSRSGTRCFGCAYQANYHLNWSSRRASTAVSPVSRPPTPLPLQRSPTHRPRNQGIAVGQAAAASILALRANDNAVGPFLNKNCPPPAPGKYQCTPGFPFIVFEGWEKVTPFVLQDSTQFRPGPPYAITDAAFKADLDEVKSLGGDGAKTPSARTAEQTQIALFWLESSPLKWSRIARTVATNKGLNHVGERAAARPAQYGAGGWLHRDGRFEEPLQFLAAGHRDSERR